MLKKNIIFKNFISIKSNSNKKKIKNILQLFLQKKNHILESLKNNYKDSFNTKILSKYKKFDKLRIVGMGGSILGAKAIYDFLNPKSKKFSFVDSFSNRIIDKKDHTKINLIISKSGNTLETISNSNILIKKKQLNIFLTENKKSYLMNLAKKLRADVIHHNNYIGGRYSVLSEVGMLPAELMGFKAQKFRRLNLMIKNKHFINLLVENVANILNLTKQKKSNSIILNYDNKSENLFYWYQQLVAESLGKKSKGILPMISNMPKDNHSLMQYYLDGTKNNFFTLFFVKDKSFNINNKKLLSTHSFLRGKNLNDISYSQFVATARVFKEKKIPFRSFFINNRNEETLGELFIFFILETILLGKAMKINPFNQPAVELIKKETKKILINFSTSKKNFR